MAYPPLSLLAFLALARTTAAAAVSCRVLYTSDTLAAAATAVNATTCASNDETYIYHELAGYGFVVSDAVDKFGDTLGGLGSAIHMDRAHWTKLGNGSYTGTLWAMPDRGWNTEGTLNFQPRVHKFSVLFTPIPSSSLLSSSSSAAAPPPPPTTTTITTNLQLRYEDTIRFSGPDGTPCTGLDADATTGHHLLLSSSYPGFPDLPVATYTGDGFGGEGSGGRRVALDGEGLHVNEDGSFWVSDEYGPYVYHFDPTGKMLAAIRPPDALIPMRNGTESFSSANPPHYRINGSDDGPLLPDPEDPDSGRANNHGFEGLSVSEDGKTLWVLLQAATVQEGGLEKQTSRYTRLLKYDVSDRLRPIYAATYMVPLPPYGDSMTTTTKKKKKKQNPKVAAQQSELHALHALPNGQFLVLARGGSAYRQIDIVDLAGATDLKEKKAQNKKDYDCSTCAAASKTTGELDDGVAPATYCGWLDFNVDAQLGRFGLHNGGERDSGLLNKKWESIAVVPMNPANPESPDDDEFFIFSLSDNDFITQNGFLNGGKFRYADSSGYSLDSQALVFRVTIPK